MMICNKYLYSCSDDLPCNVGDPGLIPGSGRYPGEGNYLAWIIPWTKEPGWLQSIVSQRVRYDLVTNNFTVLYIYIYLYIMLDTVCIKC